jgi:hypothetical protein
MRCGCLWDRLDLRMVVRYGGEAYFLPEAVWGSLLQGRRVPFSPGAQPHNRERIL